MSQQHKVWRDAVAVVTGASAGVGRATALRFAREGARVGLIARDESALDAVKAIAAEPAHANVQALHDPALAPGPANIADVVWTSQNYHDLHNVPGLDLVAFNKVLYGIVRPGGVYIVLDHSAPAGSGVSDTNTLHRIDQATVRKEVEAAGFVFDGESKVLANPADPRTVKVFDPSIRGHTDQFVLRFRKPK